MSSSSSIAAQFRTAVALNSDFRDSRNEIFTTLGLLPILIGCFYGCRRPRVKSFRQIIEVYGNDSCTVRSLQELTRKTRLDQSMPNVKI